MRILHVGVLMKIGTSICRRKLLLLLSSYVNIVLKVTFFVVSVWEGHDTVAMLDSFLPVTFIDASICPGHFAVTMAFIILIVPCVVVA